MDTVYSEVHQGKRQVFLVAVIVFVNELCKGKPLTTVTAKFTNTIYLLDKNNWTDAKL